jgi:O-antigen/teichoic acid export membrane protein
MIGQVTSTLILALATIIVARQLGPVRYGEYAVIMVPVGIATLLMDPGISEALTKYLAQYQHQGKEKERLLTQTTGCTLNIIIAGLFSLIMFVFATPISSVFLHRPELELLVRFASLSVMGQALINTSCAIFVGYYRMELQSITLVVYAALKTIAMPLLVFLGFGTAGAIIGHTAAVLGAGVAGMVLSLAFLKYKPGFLSLKPSLTEARQIFSYGAPLYASTIISGGLTQIYDSLMVIYVTTAQIGNWSVAQNFGFLISLIVVPISTALFPQFSKIEKGSLDLGHAYRDTIKYSALIALPCAAALVALSDPMIEIIYGVSYPLSSEYFRLFLLSYLTIGIGSICLPALLNGQGETRIVFRMNAMTLTVGVFLALLLIPSMAITGLIIALIISPIPANLYALLWIRRHMGLSPDWISSTKIYASSIIALAVTFLFTTFIHLTSWPKLVASAVIFLAAYTVMIKATKILSSVDYEIFRSIIDDAGPLAKPLRRIIDIIEKI